MAEEVINGALKSIPIVIEHHRKVTDPVQDKYRKMMGAPPSQDPDAWDSRTYEEKGYTLRRRNEVASDEEIVDTVRHRGQVVPRRGDRSRPGMNRRRSSMNDARNGYRGGYESEGSVPPRSRTRAKSAGSRKQGGSSSSSESSDLCSSTDEEKQVRKAQRKKWITAAFASVATIHAAQKVYSSIEAHDKRLLEVQAGEMSPEEANKKQRSQRWSDAAAVGIAALGIKGALSEWNEVQEEHKEHKEMMEKREEHHKKRLERQRQQKARERGGYYKDRNGNWLYDHNEPQDSERASSRQLGGSRNGERKMLEGPDRSRAGGRSGTRDSRGYSKDDPRSRSLYGRNDGYDDGRRRRNSRYSRDDGY